MKIESISIENFGKLHEYKVEFGEGLNVIKEDNGWGKSTLAAFIRAMFYGLEGGRKGNIAVNDRKHYKPWQGGAFGGSLVFETKGRRYKIVRTFGTKDSDDEFVLYNADTNLVSTDFSSNIGEELFHIGSESFNRTVFISQNDCANSNSSDDINARIGNISDSIDINKFESADGVLKAAINKLSTTKTGKQGRIKEEMSSIRGRIDAGAGIDAAMDELIARISTREAGLEAIRQEDRDLNELRSKVTKASSRVEKQNTYRELLAELEVKKAAMEEARAWFPGNVPTQDRFEDWEKAVGDMNKAKAVLDGSLMDSSSQILYESLADKFKNGRPSSEDIAMLLKDTDELNMARSRERDRKLTAYEEDKFSNLREMFGAETKVSAKIKDFNEKWAEKCEIDARIEVSNKGMEEDIASYKSNRKSAFILTLVIFVLAVAVGVTGALIMPDKIKGFIFIGAAVLFLIIGILRITSINKKFGKMEGEIADKRIKISELEEQSGKLSSAVETYLESHGIVYESGMKECLWTLYEDAIEYDKLHEKYIMAADNDETDKINALTEKISSYLENYGISCLPDNFATKLTELSSNSERYSDLEHRKNEQGMAERTYSESRNAIIEQLKLFNMEPMMDLAPQIANICKKGDDFYAKEYLFKDADERRSKFETENNMEEILMPLSEDEKVSPDELNARQEDINSRREEVETFLKADNNNLDGLREKYDLLQDDIEELERLNTSLQETARRRNLYDDVRTYLTTAKENLTSRYIGPLQEGFDKYYEVLTGSRDEFVLDANLNLSKTEYGVQRERASLSSGYQDLCGFCMRLSMADAMYKGEKPVLILDDPFVNLDDRKVAGARKLVDNVSENYQLIYMTCREDRL